MPSERQLMQQFDVGRSAVREALQALERKGLNSMLAAGTDQAILVSGWKSILAPLEKA